MDKDKALRKNEDVKKSNDKHIDQDFPGFPNQQPSTEAGIKKSGDKNPHFEQTDHIGSASAFGASDNVDYNPREDNENDDFDYMSRKGK